MQTSSTSGIELQLNGPSEHGGVAAPALRGKLVVRILLLVPGVLLSLIPLSTYPPLDTRVVMGITICVYLLPLTAVLLSNVRKRAVNAGRFQRGVFTYSSVALMLLGAFLLINGALDKFPRTELRTEVFKKVVLNGRYGRQYRLFVYSWRPGRSVEDLNVVQQVFDRATVGKTLIVEVHHGFFGLPWYGKISPE